MLYLQKLVWVLFLVFGINAIVHSLLIAGVAITVATFEMAKKQPQYFKGRWPRK